jgi:hypothetical protein
MITDYIFAERFKMRVVLQNYRKINSFIYCKKKLRTGAHKCNLRKTLRGLALGGAVFQTLPRMKKRIALPQTKISTALKFRTLKQCLNIQQFNSTTR